MSDDTKYRLLKLLINALGLLPITVADFCANLLGLIWFRLDRRHRQVALDNIRQAYTGQMTSSRVEILAKQVFKNLTSIPLEVAWASRFDRKKFLSLSTIKGLEHVRTAHAKGHGVIVITCHMGNFEFLISAIEGTGLKGYAIYRTLDFAPLERLVRELRQRFNVTMIPMRGASRKLETVLKQGGVVGTLLDQNVDWYKGVFVDFFGRPACTNSGLAKLALRSKAPVIPMYTVRKNRKYLIEFLPEVPRVETQDPIKDIEINTQNYTSAVESMVRRYPDQYFWVHNRWKTRNFCPWPL